MKPIRYLLASAGIAIVAACGGDVQGAAPPPVLATPVRVAPIASPDEAAVIATGRLEARDEIPLSFKTGGVVVRVTVDAGARVRQGQLLAELDLREIDAGVAKATAAADKARRDVQRVERLYRDSVATLVQWQDAQTARDVAEADLRAAKMNREYAVIVAPSNGVILERAVNPGSLVSGGTKVLALGSNARGTVFRAGLADRDVVRVRTGDRVVATFDALPGREFNGRVRLVGADADPRSGTYTIEAGLDGVSGLVNGLVGRAVIHASGNIAPGEVANDVVAIPAEALVEGNDTTGIVFVLNADGRRALRRSVTILGVEGNQVLVRGLGGVQEVVTAGAAWLSDSVLVEVRR
jgi:membrane fusion protein, multidrug efflux system